MAEPLCDLSGGEIRTAPLAAILAEALRLRVTGELRVDARGGTSRIYLRGGQPCGAQVFFGFKPLGQFLLELGWIDIEALERSLAAVVDGRRQGEALVELGYLSREQLARGLVLHHQCHIRNLAELTEGNYSFHPLGELPAWTDSLQLSAHRLIVDALAAPPGRPVAQRLLRRVPGGLGLRLRSGWDRFTGYFQFDEREAAFVSTLDRPVSIEGAIRTDLLPEGRALAVLAALQLMGILVPAPLGDVPWATPGPAIVSTPGPMTPPPPAAAPQAIRVEPEEPGLVEEVEIEVAPSEAPTVAAAEAIASSRPPSFGEETVAARPAAPAAFAASAASPVGEETLLSFEEQRRRAEEIVRRERAEREAEARRAREEALRRPQPAFRSDAEQAKERRARMLQRAFGSIIGPDGLRRPARSETPEPRGGASLWETLPAPGDPAFERFVTERLAQQANQNHFERLGLPRTASLDEIKQSFFAAAKRLHPDRIPSAVQHLAPQLKELFAGIIESYQVLQDDERRQAYLAELERPSGDDATTSALRQLEARAAEAGKRRDFAAVQRYLTEALRISDTPELRAHILWARQSERPDEAGQIRRELEKLAESHPHCAPAHYYLGVLARVAGDTAGAERAFLRTLELAPDHREARQELRLIELRKANHTHLRKR